MAIAIEMAYSKAVAPQGQVPLWTRAAKGTDFRGLCWATPNPKDVQNGQTNQIPEGRPDNTACRIPSSQCGFCFLLSDGLLVFQLRTLLHVEFHASVLSLCFQSQLVARVLQSRME